MPIQFKIKSKDEVPAELAGLYVERDGALVLDVEGAVEKSRLDEFRNSNMALLKQVEELKLRNGETAKRGNGERLTGDGSPYPEGMEDLQRQISAMRAERDALSSRLTSIQIDQGVITAATRRGLRATAVSDITARARGVFKLVGGVPTAFEGDGTTVRCGKDGVTPMSLEEWTDTQVQEAPHLFESNAGAGPSGLGPSGLAFGGRPAGRGGSGSGLAHVKNPFRRESWNLTEQMRLQKVDPQLAARLKAAA